MKNQLDKEQIESVIRAFYKVAINDVFIGYHFRKILNDTQLQNNLNNELGAFESHIPNVVEFWALQLIPEYRSSFKQNESIKKHDYLNIKKGELGRWVTLFLETLEASSLDAALKLEWRKKVEKFQIAFTQRYFKDSP